MPFWSSGGGGSSQRARTGSSMAPPGTPLGGRAALRSRLVGGVRGPEELAAAEVVLDELADDGVVELLGELLKRLGKGDLDALVEVARRDEVALRDLVDARVLVVPDGPGLAECLADEADGLVGVGAKLGVFADLTLCGVALVVRCVVREGELCCFAHRRSR